MTHKRLLLILSLFFSSITFIQAQQTGTIRGNIKDAVTKEDIIGATVIIEGQNKGASADINGFFSLNRVAPGVYSLKISFVGYKTKTIPNVKVEAEKVTEINTVIEEEGATLQEVRVVGQKLTNTEVSVISEIKAAQQIVSGISAAQIGKTQDRDAAAVAKRVPGVTIIGDRFINIRGLSQRYNNVMLHNAFTPSMETDVKSFSFDIIPSSQIDRFLVYKTPAAELPADFGVGIVKIFTKGIPERNSFLFDISFGLRNGTTFKNFKSAARGNNYWTGFDNGYNDLPSIIPAKIDPITQGTDAITNYSKAFRNDWVANEGTAMLDQRYAFTGNFKVIDANIKLGNITSVSYSNTNQYYRAKRNDFNTNINDTKSQIYDFNDDTYNNTIRVGIMHNWSLKLNEKHSFNFKNLFNQASIANYTNRFGTVIENGTTQNNHSFDQVYRGIYTGQLTGKHDFDEGKLSVDWVAGYNKSFRKQPDYRRYRSDVDPQTDQRTVFIPVGTAQAFYLGRVFTELDENSYSGSVNLTKKVAFGDQKELEIKGGGFYEMKSRDYSTRNLGYKRSASAQLDFSDISKVFQLENFGSRGVLIDEQTNPNDSYTAENKLLAYYAQVNVPITKKFNIIAGVRVEDNTQSLKSAFIGGAAVNVNNPITKVLPSVNMTYNFSEKMLLRAAYGMSLNRPEFREIAPLSFYDFNFNVVYNGNPSLKTAEIHNFDFRWEYYPTPAEVVSVALFYKDFKNAIEAEIDANAGSLGAKNFNFDNFDKAYDAGIEVELRKSLQNLSDNHIIKNTSLIFNGALIKSRITDNSQKIAVDRPLQGQSPYILNLGLYYGTPETAWQGSVLYNVVGKRIFAVGFDGYPDLYEMPRNVVDLNISRKIGKKLVVKASASDILNQSFLILQDGNRDGIFDRNKDEVIQNYKPGSSFSLGLTYSIY